MQETLQRKNVLYNFAERRLLSYLVPDPLGSGFFVDTASSALFGYLVVWKLWAGYVLPRMLLRVLWRLRSGCSHLAYMVGSLKFGPHGAAALGDGSSSLFCSQLSCVRYHFESPWMSF